VTALKAKRAELAGEVQAAEKRVDQLRAYLVHVDAVLRLFDPGAEPDAIPARRPYRRKGWFSDGELPRRILDTLRTSPEPLSASAITASVMADKSLDTGDAATLLLIRKGVQSYLRRQSGALVEPAGRKGREDDIIPAIKALFKLNRGWDVEVVPETEASQFPAPREKLEIPIARQVGRLVAYHQAA
jgi:hypothetical protein